MDDAVVFLHVVELRAAGLKAEGGVRSSLLSWRS